MADEPKSRSLLKMVCALCAAGSVIAFGIGMLAGIGSVGLAGESCKHGDCGGGSEIPMIIAGVLAVVFVVTLVLVITSRKR